MKQTLAQVKTLFTNDTLNRKGNKSANAPILKLIDIINNDNAVIETVANNSKTALNRGGTMECLIKMYITKANHVKQSLNNLTTDFEHNGKTYEIKYSSSKGYAHYNPNQDLTNLIFADQTGIYLTNGKNIILDKCGKHIQTIILNKNVKTLLTY